MDKSEEAYIDHSPLNSVSPERGRDLEGVYLARTNSGEALNPQPSNDPEDPLNWPLSLKASVHLLCSMVTKGTDNLLDWHLNPSRPFGSSSWSQCSSHQSSPTSDFERTPR